MTDSERFELPFGVTALEVADAAEMLWVVLANVSGGDWTKQSPEWQHAAAHWRDNYFAVIHGQERPVWKPLLNASIPD